MYGDNNDNHNNDNNLFASCSKLHKLWICCETRKIFVNNIHQINVTMADKILSLPPRGVSRNVQYQYCIYQQRGSVTLVVT